MLNSEIFNDFAGLFYFVKYLNLLNFSINNCDTEDMLNFSSKKSCEFITNNKDLLNLYNSS